MPLGKHYGSFAKGFMDSLMAAMKLSMTMDLYKAREEYYHDRGIAALNPKLSASQQNAAELQNQINQGRNSFGSGGGGPTSQSMQANQQEAYGQAIKDGLSDSSARALVANMSGEGLGVPGDVHQDGQNVAHGIVQWDGPRSQAIAQQFGKPPQQMSVAEQTHAAIWEMQNNPRFAASWKALQSDGPVDQKIDTLVRNYEAPGNPDKAIAQRVGYARNLPSTLGAAPTKSAANVPAKNAQSVEDDTQGGGKFVLPGSGQQVDQNQQEITIPQMDVNGAPMPQHPPSTGAMPSPPEPAAIPREMGPNPPPAGQMGPPIPTAAQKTYGPPEPSAGEKPQMGPALPPGGLPKPADVPAANSQPVSSPALPPAPSAPPQDPRFVQLAQQANANPQNSARPGPQGTALDLSHLWGPNPPLAQRAPASAPTPAPAPIRRPDDPSMVPSQLPSNMADDASLGMAIGAAKGGAIPSRPTLKFAAAGSVPNATYTPASTAPSMGTFNSLEALQNGYIPFGNGLGSGFWEGSQAQQSGATNQSVINADQVQANLNALTPAQQQWYSEELADKNSGVMGGAQAGTAQWYYNPASYAALSTPTTPAAPAATPAAAAPAAPPPVPVSQNITAPTPSTTTTDPTTTTITGAPGLPNSIQAKSYDPNVDQQTGAGFTNTNNTGGTNYSVGSDDLLKQNAAGNISGAGDTILSAKGGAITPRVRYDDGGGVNPAAAGALPGMGGSTPPPPIYYNPATYSAAGAPVGKGISATSAATSGAGAIPSLPMARGGIVRFADGGGVGDDDLQAMNIMDMQDARDDQAGAQAAPETPTPVTDKDPGFYINPQQVASNAPASPSAATASPPATQTDHLPPPDPTAPQIKDDAGNPSKGLIGAISDGLHWLGSHLGIGGAQAAVAPDPQTQTNRMQHATNDPQGATYMTPQNAEELKDIADPGHQLQDAYRNIAGLEQGYKWALSRGDDATAGRLAASMLHYSVIASQNLSTQAAHALYNGDPQKAVDYMNQSSDAVPDGRLVHATLNKDGTVTIQGKNLNGQVEWQQHGAAQEILERATSLGRSGKLQWDSLESQAAKYDSTFAEMAKNRQANKIAQGKQDQSDAANSGEAAILASMHQPRVPGGGAPAITPVSKPALPPAPTRVQTAAQTGAPPTPDSTGTAQQNAPPPQTGPGEAGDTGYQPSPLPPTPSSTQTAALPPPPNAADLPAPGAQDADSGPAPPMRPDENPIYVSLPQAQKEDLQRIYNEDFKRYQDQVNESRKEARADRRESFTQSQTTEREKFSQTEQDQRAAHSDAAAAQRAATQQAFETKKEQDAREHDMTKPRDPKEVAAAFNPAPNESGVPTGKEPTTYMAEAMGYKKPDGTPDLDMLNKNFNQEEQQTMGQAMMNGYGLSPRTTAPMITKAITGTLTDPNYIMHKTEISPDKTYGVPRYSVTVEHKGSGTSTSFILPVEDYNNLKALYTQRQAAATKPAAPVVTAPTPRAPAFPGAAPGPAPTGGFNAPPQRGALPGWLGLGKTPSGPSFPAPNPNQPPQRGFIQ
jgi:Phage tail lysozyme